MNDFVKIMAGIMKRPVFLPHVPAWLLRTAMGERSEILLNGSRISGEKIINAGFSFRYEKLEEAMKEVIRG
jgi:NAD dependent epimerase/dehydratase family enzyme